MNRFSMFKYDAIIYTSLLISFVCAITSVIESSSALKQDVIINEQPVVEEKVDIIEEPSNLVKVDKVSLAQKYIDSIADQILTDEILTLEIVNSWETYSIKSVKYKKTIMENYYQYEVEVQVTGSQLQLPKHNNMIVTQTNEYTDLKMYMNIHYSDYRKGYLVKTLEVPSEIA